MRLAFRQARLSDVLVACRDGLPRCKVPDDVECLDQFPLTDNLKIDRPALAQRAATAIALQSVSAVTPPTVGWRGLVDVTPKSPHTKHELTQLRAKFGENQHLSLDDSISSDHMSKK